jgi:N-methylhydantoinase A
MIRLAFDIGGTFTDFVLQDDTANRLWTAKVATSADAPEHAVLAGLEQLKARSAIALARIDVILHATTAATNAIVERKGAQVGLITTSGFRDVLIIGRQKRYETYDLYLDKRAPLLKRRHIHEVTERVNYEGDVLEPLDLAMLDHVIDNLVETERDAVAVSLLHAYANPTHERAIRQRIHERLPTMSVSLSSDVSPKFREYERTNTTVANAYIKPLVDRYIAGLEAALRDRGFVGELFIMQSAGGLVPTALARQHPVRIVESGPAAGVLMCAEMGHKEGFNRIVTFDMGGTTAKLGAVDDGEPSIIATLEVDPIRSKKGSGLPLNTPAIELVEIGSGGGSLASADSGIIVVGPESAGSHPGPACYGRGGTRATLTDANVALGYIDPTFFNGGADRLDATAAYAAIERDVAKPLGMGIAEAAWGIHLIATTNMEHALRLVSIERGRDPRECALVAFGGAGPLHACRLARCVGIPTVIVPLGAGVGSAIGLLRADARFDASITRVLRLDAFPDKALAELYADLERQVCETLSRVDFAGGIRWTRYAYMRYAGQGFEIRVDLPAGDIGPGYAAAAATTFQAVYRQKYLWSGDDSVVEGVDWTLVAAIPTARCDLASSGITTGASSRKWPSRAVWFPECGGFTDTVIVDRNSLAQRKIFGPAIVQDPDCTVVVLPGDAASASLSGHVRIDIDGASTS